MPYLTACPGNPSNRNHRFGWEAAEAVERARSQVAALLNAPPATIIFTSGATESNNFAIKGAAASLGRPPGSTTRGGLITSATEHKAVLDPCASLAREGFDLTVLTPGPDGVITGEMVREALRDDTILVSVMWANNETGVINDIPGIGAVCKDAGVCFHTDATQGVGKLPIDLEQTPVVLLSLSGHKIYGPKGVGAVHIRDCDRTTGIRAMIEGGGQERNIRCGTLNVPGIVGLGAACELCRIEMDAEPIRLGRLRDGIESGLLERLDGLHINGRHSPRLPNITSISFERMDGEALMMVATGVACSSASACSSMTITPSHVLTAMSVPPSLAMATLRLSLGRPTTATEADQAVDRIAGAVLKLRELAPLLGFV